MSHFDHSLLPGFSSQPGALHPIGLPTQAGDLLSQPGVAMSLGVAPQFSWTAAWHPSPVQTAHATTIAALTSQHGVVIAADRQSTRGHAIARRDVKKLLTVDSTSVVGLAGSVGPAYELAKLFIMEVESHEKIEHSALTLDGKANLLSRLIAAHMPKAMQGFVVLPLLVGYDHALQTGRIIEMDIAGGSWDEHRFAAIGSGGVHAKAALQATWNKDLSTDSAVELAAISILTASQEDTGTSGIDTIYRTYPIVMVITEDGLTTVPQTTVQTICEDHLASLSSRMELPSTRTRQNGGD